MSSPLLATSAGPTSAPEALRAPRAGNAGSALCVVLIGWCVLIVGAGCTAGPDYVRPCPPGLYPVYESGKSDEARHTDLTHWWTHFEDPVLDQLVTVAWQQNLDLRAAGFRILQARAQRGVVRGGLFPQVDNTESYRYKLASSNAKQPLERDDANWPYDLFSAGFDVTWEIDVFGKIRRSLQAADAEIGVQVEDYRGVLVTLLGDVALNYVKARLLEERLEIARENLASQEQTLAMVRRRKEAGLVGRLEVAQAESNVYLTASTIPPLEEERQVTLNRLSILLGQSPGRDMADWLGDGRLPGDPGLLGLGVPADLIRRRPDVRRAEYEVAVASAGIGVAMADLYPQFTITGTITVDSRNLSSLLAPASFAHSVGPGVRWDILNFGRVRSNIRVREARHNEALIEYQNTVLVAVEEVENGMVGYQRSLSRVGSLRSAVGSARDAARLSRTQYERGLIGFQTLVDTERQRLLSEEQLAISRGTVLLSLIRTFKALGGGWEAPLPTATVPPEVPDAPDEPLAPEEAQPPGQSATPIAPMPPQLGADESEESSDRADGGVLGEIWELGQRLTRQAKLVQQ